MNTKLLKAYIVEAMHSSPKGAMRKTKSGAQQYKIGKVEDENRELSAFEAEQLFPGSTIAWAEIVPEMFPDFPFTDVFSIRKNSSWFKIGDKLHVAFSDMPQIELGVWSPERDDWLLTGDMHECCYAGSQPEESYNEDLTKTKSFKKKSVLVPDDIKKSIKKYTKSMGLTR